MKCIFVVNKPFMMFIILYVVIALEHHNIVLIPHCSFYSMANIARKSERAVSRAAKMCLFYGRAVVLGIYSAPMFLMIFRRCKEENSTIYAKV